MKFCHVITIRSRNCQLAGYLDRRLSSFHYTSDTVTSQRLCSPLIGANSHTIEIKFWHLVQCLQSTQAGLNRLRTKGITSSSQANFFFQFGRCDRLFRCRLQLKRALTRGLRADRICWPQWKKVSITRCYQHSGVWTWIRQFTSYPKNTRELRLHWHGVQIPRLQN